MPGLPNALALASIPAGSEIVSADHRNNYAAIQSAVNDIITALSGGSDGQLLQALSASSIGFVAGATQIADVELAADTATIDFSNIPATGAHLLLAMYGRGDNASAACFANLRFNNDASGLYYDQNVQGAAAAASAAEDLAQTSGSAIRLTAGAAANPDDFGGGLLLIPFYTSTKRHPWVGISFASPNTTTGNQLLDLVGGVWKQSAAIDRLTLLPNVGANFKAGTKATLYRLG